MGMRMTLFKRTVAAFLFYLGLIAPSFGQETSFDDLFDALLAADVANHEAIADQIRDRWSKSGSAALDLLYRRGGEAMETGEPNIAIEHFTALVDHAPDFAEGYHARASAYFAAGLIGPAIDDLRQTLVMVPNHFEAMFGLGNIMEGLERPEDALEVYQTILGIYPLNQNAIDAISRLEEQLEGQSI